MEPHAHSVLSVWLGVLRPLPTRRCSFFVSSLFAPVLFWFLGAALAGLNSTVSFVGLAMLGGLTSLGLAASLSCKRWKSRGPSARPTTRGVVLTHQVYFVLAVLAISFYSLVIAHQMSLRIGVRIGGLLAIAYGLSGIAGVVWGPRSLSRSAGDDLIAAKREVKWLPWVMALQGGLVSLGVFLGVWAAQGRTSWTYYLSGGLGALAALLLVTLGFISLYRLVVLASNPIPDEAYAASGTRP